MDTVTKKVEVIVQSKGGPEAGAAFKTIQKESREAAKSVKEMAEELVKTRSLNRQVKDLADQIEKLQQPIKTTKTIMSEMLVTTTKNMEETKKKIEEVTASFKRMGVTAAQAKGMTPGLSQALGLSAAEIGGAFTAAQPAIPKPGLLAQFTQMGLISKLIAGAAVAEGIRRPIHGLSENAEDLRRIRENTSPYSEQRRTVSRMLPPGASHVFDWGFDIAEGLDEALNHAERSADRARTLRMQQQRRALNAREERVRGQLAIEEPFQETQRSLTETMFMRTTGKRLGEREQPLAPGFFRADQERIAQGEKQSETARAHAVYLVQQEDAAHAKLNQTMHEGTASIAEQEHLSRKALEATLRRTDATLAYGNALEQQRLLFRGMRVQEEVKKEDLTVGFAGLHPSRQLEVLRAGELLQSGDFKGRFIPEDIRAILSQYHPEQLRKHDLEYGAGDLNTQTYLRQTGVEDRIARNRGLEQAAEGQRVQVESKIEANISINEKELEKVFMEKILPAMYRTMNEVVRAQERAVNSAEQLRLRGQAISPEANR